MIAERTFLIKVVQRYEGEPPENWDLTALKEDGSLGSDQDQYVCDNWELVSDLTELLDNDQLDSYII